MHSKYNVKLQKQCVYAMQSTLCTTVQLFCQPMQEQQSINRVPTQLGPSVLQSTASQ